MASVDNQYKALYKLTEYASKSFQRTRNVPIDTSFLLEKIEEIDEKIPIDIRYSGLTFFVKNAEINAGVTKGNKNINGYENGEITLGPITNKSYNVVTGLLYTFDENLKPIPLHDTVLRYIINAISVTENNYNRLNTYLNNVYAKAGTTILIDNLDITVICDYQGNWKYHSGDYKVSSEYYYNLIPDNLKQPNKVVEIGENTRKIITSDKKLSDEIIKTDSISDCTENGRFYNVNDYIYYCFGGSVIPVSDKFIVKNNIKLEENKSLEIEHNFNSRYLTCYGIINQNSENVNNDYVNYCFPLEHKYINNNKISIISSLTIESIDICLVSKI